MQFRLFAAAAALILCVATAFAGHATSHLDALSASVDARLTSPELSKAQSKALNAAKKALAKNTTTVSADAAALAKAAKALAKAFLGDATFEADLDAAIASFSADASSDQQSLAALLGALPDSKKKAAAQKQFDKVAPLLEAVLGATTDADALVLLSKAESTLGKGFKLAAGGDNFLIASVDGAAFVSQLTGASYLFSTLTVTGVDYDGRAFFSTSRGLALTAGPLSGTGTFTLSTQTKYSTNPKFGGEGTQWLIGGPGTGGTVQITRFDQASHVVEGLFTFTAGNAGESPATVTVTNGRFRARLP
jgi:hypothetical protein